MILNSYQFEYSFLAGEGSTDAEKFIDMDFTSLYQINPDHLVILKYFSIVGLRQDASSANVNDTVLMARLIGNFNESRNIGAVVVAPAVNSTIVKFDGLVCTDRFPFRAVESDMILMPPTFQISFRKGAFIQAVAGDTLTVWFSLGYDIQLKSSRF